MASIQEMAEVHLLNVEREINVLNERKEQVEQEIDRLTAYLAEGKQAVMEAQSTVPAQRN
jgi:cell division septum initiation protein DivIVA